MNTFSGRVEFCLTRLLCLLVIAYSFSIIAQAQSFERRFDLGKGGSVEIINFYGRVKVEANETLENTAELKAQSSVSVAERDLEINVSDGRLKIEVIRQTAKRRIDLVLQVPERVRVKVETKEGEVALVGNLSSAEVITDTGTISTNIPLENIRYEFWWIQSRPRYLSDIEIEKVKEKSAGRFTIAGKYFDPEAEARRIEKAKEKENSGIDSDLTGAENTGSKRKDQKSLDNSIFLKFSTDRGIILLNVSPTEVSSDLRERPLTEAAKAIVRSGDSMLMEAIRRSSPKYFGDYLRTLPPRMSSPSLSDKPRNVSLSGAKVKQVVVRVMDVNNRSVGGLGKDDFVLSERGFEREIISVDPVTTPFNLVLLLDVSGSIENYVNFIRKAARNFLNTMNPQDRISILIFNEKINQIATFSTDRGKLSESLDTFDAGGGTAYYDAIAYTLVDTLKPFKGERTAVVILSDGDDNRSFLPFESLIGSIQESGALIYPLYVPSALIAASSANDPDDTSDPLRTRYMGLTSKAEREGARLAQVSGGVYYPIRRIDELQKAYEDIVVQLRTAYTLTFRSDVSETGDSASPRLRVKVNRDGTFVNLGAVTPVSN